MTVRPFDEVFRDFVIPNVPASGVFHPEKKDIRDSLNAVIAGTFPDNRVIRLNNADEGTANNIVVTASVAIPAAAYQVLYILNVTQENTGPVTVSGAINRALVTNINQPLPAGYLTPGMAVLCIDTGTELRLLSYGDVESVVEDILVQAEAAKDAAELARDQAQNAASDAVSQGNVPIYSTRNAIETLTIPAGISAFRTNGFYAVGDGGSALYKRVSTEPTHAGKVQSADGSWWEIVGSDLSVKSFGAKGEGEAGSADAIRAALGFLPIGGILRFPAGRYRSPDIWDRSDISYIGEKMPVYRSDNSALKNGTIIEGRAIFHGDNICIVNIGVDCGETVCTELYGGAGNDAFVIHDKDLSGVRKNITAKNIIGLCKNSEVPYHAVLLEGLTNSIFENVTGCFGWYPVVFKALKSKISNVFAYRAGHTGIFIKSDSYAPTQEIEAVNLSYEDLGSGATNGVCINAATSPLSYVTVSNVRSWGGLYGFTLQGENRANFPGNYLSAVQASNVQCYNQEDCSYLVLGAVVGCAIDNFKALFPTTGRCFNAQTDVYSLRLTNGFCTFNTSPAPDNFAVGGGTEFDNITVCQAWMSSILGTITVVQDGALPLGVGNYTANLSLNIGTEGLQNGWGVQFGDSPKVRIENNRLLMTGRVSVPPLPWTGKNKFYQLPVSVKTDQTFTLNVYRPTGAIVPVTVDVNQGGEVVIQGLNDATQFPTDAVFMYLSGINISIN